MSFAKTLKRLREAKKITRYALAKRTGMTFQAISYLESGTNLVPRWDTVQKIADALGVPVEVFRDVDGKSAVRSNMKATKTAKPLTGPIEIGDVLIWKPSNLKAKATITITGVRCSTNCIKWFDYTDTAGRACRASEDKIREHCIRA